MLFLPAESDVVVAAVFTAGCLLIHVVKRFADAVTVALVVVGVLASIGIGANMADRSMPAGKREPVRQAEVVLPLN